MAVAVNCWFEPVTIVALGGATLMDANTSCTVRDVEPASDP